jgi:hypothetical protein
MQNTTTRATYKISSEEVKERDYMGDLEQMEGRW